jgi:hypothetical protein
MFGITAFAQAPFASLPLGGNQFILAISEDFTSADASTQLSAFLQSITEPIIV